MTSPRALAGALLASSALALGCANQATAPQPSASSSPSPAPGSTPAATAPPAATTPPAAPAGWVLGPRGAGPVHFGMTLDEMRAAVPGGVRPLGPEGECAYYLPAGAPAGLAFMVVDGRVMRADVQRGSGVATSIGVRSGDSEESALERLGPQTTVTPHKYVEGHYLTAPTGEDDTWWVVATDHGVVTDVRAGLMPQVRWVEGCS